MKPKKIFFLITVFLFLLTSSVSASLQGESVDIADLKDQRTFSLTDFNHTYSDSTIGKDISDFILETTDGNTKKDFTNLSMSNMPMPFPGKGPNPWGPSPHNPGYPHFIERPNVGNPPFVAVAPEPISYVLFIIGAMLFAGRAYVRRKKYLSNYN